MIEQELIARLNAGVELTVAEIDAAAAALLHPDAPVETRADFLRALTRKGETPAEIAAFVRAFLRHAVRPPVDLASLGRPAIDVCGTGGDKLGLFNISTASMFLLAGAGATVVKHGNRGVTSPSGSADVLEALGVPVSLSPDAFAEQIGRHHLGFMLAPAYHPAFKSVVPVRKKLADEGTRTIFNLIGPLLNPLQPEFQLAGVFADELVQPYARIMADLGRTRAWAVHGHTADGRGMDELSILGPNHVAKAENGTVTEETIDLSPDFAGSRLAQLAGGSARQNAEMIESLLRGEVRGPKRDIVVLNAAAGLVVCGLAGSLADGRELAEESLDSRRAFGVLQAVRP